MREAGKQAKHGRLALLFAGRIPNGWTPSQEHIKNEVHIVRDFDWKIIYTLKQTGNVTRAASLLFVTQPTLTRRIQLIEEELGFPILIRGAKGISLTPAGEHVAEYAKKILELVDQMHLELAGFSSGEIGPLRLGVPPAYALFVIPPFIEKFTERHPNVKLDMLVDYSSALRIMIENRELNIAVVRGETDSSVIKSRLLAEDQVCIVCAKPFSLEQLPSMPRIDFIRESSVTRKADIWWKEHFNAPPYIRMRMNSCQQSLEMVRYHLGYAIVSDSKYLKRVKGEFFSMPMFFKNGRPLTSTTHVIYHHDEEYNPLVQNLLRFMDEVDINTLP